jgi:hypothetical protein
MTFKRGVLCNSLPFLDIDLLLCSRSQYERQFKKWDFRKNMRQPERLWKAVGHRIEKRKKAGKNSDVYINGSRILASVIRKEILRYDHQTAMERYGPG